MARYEIYPNTYIDGEPLKNIPVEDGGDDCRNFCDYSEDCVGYAIDKKTLKCNLYSQINSFSYDKSKQTYVKKRNENYYVFWIFLFGVILILFINRCRNP